MEEMKLKPFDKVLVRNGNKGAWTPDIFKFYDDYELEKPFTCIGGNYSQCIAYENNEKLIFTNEDYIADVEFEEDLPIDTPVMACRILNDWHFGYYMGNNRIATEKSNITQDYERSVSVYSYLKYIIKVEDFDFNNPENSLKYNKVK